MSLTLEQFGIDRLSPQERSELIELIWDSLPPETPFTPPAWHIRELERRVAAFVALRTGYLSRFSTVCGWALACATIAVPANSVVIALMK